MRCHPCSARVTPIPSTIPRPPSKKFQPPIPQLQFFPSPQLQPIHPPQTINPLQTKHPLHPSPPRRAHGKPTAKTFPPTPPLTVNPPTPRTANNPPAPRTANTLPAPRTAKTLPAPWTALTLPAPRTAVTRAAPNTKFPQLVRGNSPQVTAPQITSHAKWPINPPASVEEKCPSLPETKADGHFATMSNSKTIIRVLIRVTHKWPRRSICTHSR